MPGKLPGVVESDGGSATNIRSSIPSSAGPLAIGKSSPDCQPSVLVKPRARMMSICGPCVVLRVSTLDTHKTGTEDGDSSCDCPEPISDGAEVSLAGGAA